jgi:hypothetical protein
MEGPIMGVRRSQLSQLKKRAFLCCMKEKGMWPMI